MAHLISIDPTLTQDNGSLVSDQALDRSSTWRNALKPLGKVAFSHQKTEWFHRPLRNSLDAPLPGFCLGNSSSPRIRSLATAAAALVPARATILLRRNRERTMAASRVIVADRKMLGNMDGE
jgi:hypothetical protein